MDAPHRLDKRDVVITLSSGDGVERCLWLMSIPADMPSDEALAGCAAVLLPMAVECGDVEPTGDVSFKMRPADIEIDGDLYLQEAREAGTLH